MEEDKVKRYQLVTKETLANLYECFQDAEEVITFIQQMESVLEEIEFSRLLRLRVTEAESSVAMLREICAFAMFCRDHMDLVQQLVASIRTVEINEDEMKKITGQ